MMWFPLQRSFPACSTQQQESATVASARMVHALETGHTSTLDHREPVSRANVSKPRHTRCVRQPARDSMRFRAAPGQGWLVYCG